MTFAALNKRLNEPLPTAFGQKEVITKKELKPFLSRSDLPGLANFIGHIAVMVGSGYLLYLALGTWWVAPAVLLHGIIVSFLFAPMHECSHGTPFRTRWLNETVFHIVSFFYLAQPVMFRYAHAAHHTYTNIRGWDPDMTWPENPKLKDYLWFISAIPLWRTYLVWPLRHALLGRLDEADRYYVPDSEVSRIVREARACVALYFLITAAALWFGFGWELLVFWIIPRLLGEPFMRAVRVAEHWGCEETGDLRENTRTTKTLALLRFICWNMNYHAEHHLVPLTPFHQLPALHEHLQEKLRRIGESYPAVHGEVLRGLR